MGRAPVPFAVGKLARPAPRGAAPVATASALTDSERGGWAIPTNAEGAGAAGGTDLGGAGHTICADGLKVAV